MKIKGYLKIFHTNHRITKAPDELRAKISSLYYHTLSLVHFFLQKTKSNTVQRSPVNRKKWRCKIENRAVGSSNNVERAFLLVRLVFFKFNVLLQLVFYR